MEKIGFRWPLSKKNIGKIDKESCIHRLRISGNISVWLKRNDGADGG